VTLADLAGLLRDQQARAVDIVAPATAIRARHGQLRIECTHPVLGADGVTTTAGSYTPTQVCDQGLADKLGIPAGYLRQLREHRPGLYDANVNGWLDGAGACTTPARPAATPPDHPPSQTQRRK